MVYSVVLGLKWMNFLYTKGKELISLAISKPNPCDPETKFVNSETDDQGFTIQYPKGWYALKLKDGDWFEMGNPETGEKGQEYLLAITTLKNNFEPGSSKDGEVIRLFITRNQAGSNNTPEQYIETIKQQNQQFNFGFNITSKKITVGETEGILLYMERGSDSWIVQNIIFNHEDYTYTLNGNIYKGEHQNDCIKILDNIQQSFLFSN
jgi:hypothetical protein